MGLRALLSFAWLLTRFFLVAGLPYFSCLARIFLSCWRASFLAAGAHLSWPLPHIFLSRCRTSFLAAAAA